MDYLAGQRRYMPGEADADKYRYFARDHQGSVLMMTDHEQNVEEYKYDAWGEHIDSAALPSTANNIRYAGLRLECFVDSGNSAGAIYETGARHYWPRIGRFLQRDPLTYNSLPNPSKPLGLNPYIYCENNPVMAVDASGLKSSFVRGATMGKASMWLGTFRPGYLYDCCAENFTTVPEDKRWNAYLIWHQTLGYIRLKDAAKFFHWKKFCDFDPSVAQPDKGCANTTWINPDLACTFLEECKHGSCAKPGGDIINGGGGGNGGTGGGGGAGGGGGSCGGGGCPGKHRPPFKGGGGEGGGVGGGVTDSPLIDTDIVFDVNLATCWQQVLDDNLITAWGTLSGVDLIWFFGFITTKSMITLALEGTSVFSKTNFTELADEISVLIPERFCEDVAECYRDKTGISEDEAFWLSEKCTELITAEDPWIGQLPHALHEYVFFDL